MGKAADKEQLGLLGRKDDKEDDLLLIFFLFFFYFIYYSSLILWLLSCPSLSRVGKDGL